MSDGLDYSRRNKEPRPLSNAEKARLEEFAESIHYSARYVYSGACYPAMRHGAVHDNLTFAPHLIRS